MSKKPVEPAHIERPAGVAGGAATPAPIPSALTNVPILSAVPIVTPTGNDYIPVARVGDKTAYRAPLPIGESIVRPLMDGVADPGNSVRFSRADHVHPVDTSLASKSYVDTQDAAIVSQVPPASTSAPAMDGVAAVGVASSWARADHVHASDVSRYEASNPAGYVSAAAASAAAPVQSVASRTGAVTLRHDDIVDWADALAPYPRTVDLPPASTELPVVNGAASAGIEFFWSRADHIHPVDPTRYAADNPAGYQTAAQVTAVVPVASSTAPLPSATTAVVGAGTTWARADHVHPLRPGVTNASEAAPGQVGEYIVVSNATGVTLPTNVPKSICALPLTPGDWEIWGTVDFRPAAGVSPNGITAAISTTTDALPTDTDLMTGVGVLNMFTMPSFTSGQRQVLMTGTCRSNRATPLTVYLVGQVTLGGSGVLTGRGYICARRVR